jgi:two-component system repressor protein LuxO
MSQTLKILLVEDTASLAEVYKQYLADEPFEILIASDGASAKSLISEQKPDLVLLDLKLPDIPGQEILAWIHQQDKSSAVIVMTAHSSVEVAVEVMRAGADDYLEKPFSATRLKTTLHNVLQHKKLVSMVAELESSFERKAYHGFVGQSLPMQAVYRIIEAAAPSKATVFITGESGTGKEVCAEAIHQASKGSSKPFIAINCAAIPKDLMESEIFGHTRGAFTGATNERKGAAELADGGTLFLDEIGEMGMDLQTKLLRFVQTGRFQKVGSSKEQSVDVRFVCATNRDPYAEVLAGRFREDLYYRLHVVPVHLPPLRERGDDIMIIARDFLDKYAREEGKNFSDFSPQVDVVFRRYAWPGNVRQLQNVIRNIVVLQNGDTVTPQHLPPPLDTYLNSPEIQSTAEMQALGDDESSSASANSRPPGIRPLADVERETIERAIDFCDGNIPKAAALLEVSPSTIYRKKQAWEDQA